MQLSNLFVDTAQGVTAFAGEDGAVDALDGFDQGCDLVQQVEGRGVAINAAQLSEGFAGLVVFLQRLFVFIKAAQRLLQLLPRVQLVGEELVQVAVVLFEVKIGVFVVGNDLEEIDAVVVAEQAFEAKERLFNGAFTGKVADIGFVFVALEVGAPSTEVAEIELKQFFLSGGAEGVE